MSVTTDNLDGIWGDNKGRLELHLAVSRTMTSHMWSTGGAIIGQTSEKGESRKKLKT